MTLNQASDLLGDLVGAVTHGNNSTMGDANVFATVTEGLLIAGERNRPKDSGHYQQLEIDYGPFQRQVTLAEDVDPDRATATYERGLLTVRLPIAPQPAERQSISIVVTSG